MIVARKKYYAVRRGHRTGIFTEWFGPQGAQAQVEGFAGALYRGFATRAEAQAFLEGSPPSAKRAPTHQSSLIESGGQVVVFTDGGAIGNPGPGGYGVVIFSPNGERQELSGGYRRTTNNRMELMACITALEHLHPDLPIILHSDSRYLVDAVNKRWVFGWQKRGWKKADGQPAKNQDLWERLLKRLDGLQVTFRWVKGHAGQEWNERCDQLAGQAMSQADLPADAAYENSLGNTRGQNG
jgi:ribonuclease HI